MYSKRFFVVDLKIPLFCVCVCVWFCVRPYSLLRSERSQKISCRNPKPHKDRILHCLSFNIVHGRYSMYCFVDGTLINCSMYLINTVIFVGIVWSLFTSASWQRNTVTSCDQSREKKAVYILPFIYLPFAVAYSSLVNLCQGVILAELPEQY